MAKDYFNSVYDKFWEKQTKVYGVTSYEKYIIHEIMKRSPKKVFEVGIGNAWPIGVALHRKNIKVCGCDVSKRLVESAQKNLHCQDGIWVGELKDIKQNVKYNIVYCVRTSWCIADFFAVLDKMITMMDEQGYLIFDIMEKSSLYYIKMCWNQIKTKVCSLIGLERTGERKLYFYSRRKIENLLKKRGIQFQSYNERVITKSKDYWNTPKRIYVCKKGES